MKKIKTKRPWLSDSQVLLGSLGPGTMYRLNPPLIGPAHIIR